MAIHVQDEEADWLLREFARRRGLGLTAALKIAVREASRQEDDRVATFMARIQPVIDRSRARQVAKGATTVSQRDDKAFMDEMWGEEK
ncbi:type II toxin-antitoxin system VapB family antitoxin [Mesorhizobium sp. CAU 1741]|uniref:type II toxin-antitoxin system VapB family antitoxin n=1 Tax=Mesorhizobium sp. CAU 1741 TaxID=3140366 RepID=UPI00325C0FEB